MFALFSANRPLDIFKSADDKIDCSSFLLRAFTYCHGMTHMHRQLSRHIHTMVRSHFGPTPTAPTSVLRVRNTRHAPKSNRSTVTRHVPQSVNVFFFTFLGGDVHFTCDMCASGWNRMPSVAKMGTTHTERHAGSSPRRTAKLMEFTQRTP